MLLAFIEKENKYMEFIKRLKYLFRDLMCDIDDIELYNDYYSVFFKNGIVIQYKTAKSLYKFLLRERKTRFISDL